MRCQQDDAVVVSTAEWLAELSERAQAHGDEERADLLFFWAGSRMMGRRYRQRRLKVGLLRAIGSRSVLE